MDDDLTCASCGRTTPPGSFCVRCGAPLTVREGEAAARPGRSSFSAAPGEHAWAPRLISTLFPALPQVEMANFRVVFVVGVAIVVALAAAGLFPVALFAAALLVPILVSLYLWDVDVYEDQPWRVVLLTLGWGVVAGAVIGFASTGLQAPGADAAAGGGGDLLRQAVALPIAGLLLALAGPVILLLPRARFNDVLDGATFGATAAATLTLGQVLAHGFTLLGAGLRPVGDTLPWIVRVLGIAVGTPVLAMCAAAGIASALWLRYRAPVADRRALGLLGRPLPALLAGCVLVVAGAVAQATLPGGWWLLVLTLLDLAGILWLRSALHVGLREEAGEHDPGPPLMCPECGVATPEHAFCGNCGVARQANPKGDGGKLGGRRLVIVPIAALVAGAALFTAVGAVAAPGALQPRCTPGRACGGPPPPLAPLAANAAYRDPDGGWSFDYPPGTFVVSATHDAGVELRTKESVGRSLTVDVRVAPASDGDAAAALTKRASDLGTEILALAPDKAPEHAVLGAMVGYRRGVAGVYGGTVDSPQGPGQAITVVVLAAGDGRTVATVTAASTERDADRRRQVLGLADGILQSFRFGTAP